MSDTVTLLFPIPLEHAGRVHRALHNQAAVAAALGEGENFRILTKHADRLRALIDAMCNRELAKVSA